MKSIYFCWFDVDFELGRPFKAKTLAEICRGFAVETFGTSFCVKNVAWNLYNFVGLMLILSLVGLFKAKTFAEICRGFAVERFGMSF